MTRHKAFMTTCSTPCTLLHNGKQNERYWKSAR